jgi:hypothetical protein
MTSPDLCPEGRTDHEACFAPFRYCPVKGCGRTEAQEPPVVGPKPFVLRRNTDVSGVSGTGIVAQGVEFQDGTVALRWMSAWPTSVVFHDKGIDAVRAIHGHDGATEIVFT